jgi:hypothetical protein
MKTFNDTVVQTKDVNLHGFGYSEDFVALVEQNLLLVNTFSYKTFSFDLFVLSYRNYQPLIISINIKQLV